MKHLFKSFTITLGVGLLLIAGVITFGYFRNQSQRSIPETSETIKEEMEELTVHDSLNLTDEAESDSVTLAFAGDVYFTEFYQKRYDELGISAFADETMLSYMRDADIFMLNHEFALSSRGEPMADKTYTLRCDPRYVSVLEELGADLVSIANNHVLDFGRTAFLDTLNTLQNANIDYVGGGMNLEEALKPAAYTIQGQTFAIFAATRVLPTTDWYAYKNSPGILQTYDPKLLNEAIAEAETEYDHIIVFAHWGVERNVMPEDYQRTLAKGYIDAGADLVIGCHPHVLQGYEYYEGVPIIYSLGNYLFSNHQDTTLLLQAEFSPEGELTIKLIPCQRVDYVLKQMEQPENLFSQLSDISYGVRISSDGILTPHQP